MASIPHFSEWVTKADLAVLGSQLATKADVANAEAAIINAITSLTTLLKADMKPLATSANVAAAQAAITQELMTMSMTQQQQADADLAAIKAVEAQLTTAVAAIEAEIAALQAANPTVDLTALNAEVANLGTVAATVAAIPPAAPPAA